MCIVGKNIFFGVDDFFVMVGLKMVGVSCSCSGIWRGRYWWCFGIG